MSWLWDPRSQPLGEKYRVDQGGIRTRSWERCKLAVPRRLKKQLPVPETFNTDHPDTCNCVAPPRGCIFDPLPLEFLSKSFLPPSS